MAAANEIKLFGKWSFADVEVRKTCRRWAEGSQPASAAWRGMMDASGGVRAPNSSPASRSCTSAGAGGSRPPAASMLASERDAGSAEGLLATSTQLLGSPGSRLPAGAPRAVAPVAAFSVARSRVQPACLQVSDISLEDYIAVKPQYARFTTHSAGRFQKRRFRKAQCPIVER